MVLNSYFLTNKDNHIFQDIVRWRKNYPLFHILYVNVHALARKQDKIPQNTLCLLLSILNKGIQLFRHFKHFKHSK